MKHPEALAAFGVFIKQLAPEGKTGGGMVDIGDMMQNEGMMKMMGAFTVVLFSLSLNNFSTMIIPFLFFL